jgi:hypothetical protein
LVTWTVMVVALTPGGRQNKVSENWYPTLPVLGDVLVARLGEVVDAVNVAPEHGGREVGAHVHRLVRARGVHHLAPRA